jgi:cytochrome b561
MKIRNSEQGWGFVSVLIHWFTAVAVVGMFALGLWMVELTYYDQWYRQAPFIHKSIGVLLFLLTLARLLWRWSNQMPADLPAHKAFEKRAARIGHGLIYLLLFAIMISGYLISTADGRPVDVFNWFSIPATVHGYELQEDIAGLVHLVLAVSLITLVSMHAVAALKHHFIDRDRTLLRMLGK